MEKAPCYSHEAFIYVQPVLRASELAREILRKVEGSSRLAPNSQKETAPRYSREAVIYVGDDLLSHTLSRAVQSAQRGLTSVFGMGTGISPAV